MKEHPNQISDSSSLYFGYGMFVFAVIICPIFALKADRDLDKIIIFTFLAIIAAYTLVARFYSLKIWLTASGIIVYSYWSGKFARIRFSQMVDVWGGSGGSINYNKAFIYIKLNRAIPGFGDKLRFLSKETDNYKKTFLGEHKLIVLLKSKLSSQVN